MTAFSSTSENPPPPHSHPHSIFPDKVFTVIGLESSGTTFLAETLRNALGLRWIGNKDTYEAAGEGFSNHYYNTYGLVDETKYWTEVQHVSLPWGGKNCYHDPHQDVIPVLYPAICTKMMRDRMRMLNGNPWLESQQKESQQKNGPFAINYLSDKVLRTYKIPTEMRNETLSNCSSIADYWTYPARYSLNLTSHLDWYQSKGIDARAIIIMRDSTISRRARQGHCTNSTIMALEEELGRDILQEAIHKHIITRDRQRRRLVQASSNGRVVLVSYELLNQLKGDYLALLYKELGINSTIRPIFKDGNVKHVRDDEPQTRMQLKVPETLSQAWNYKAP